MKGIKEKSLKLAEEFMIEALTLEQRAEEQKRKAMFWLEVAKLDKTSTRSSDKKEKK